MSHQDDDDEGQGRWRGYPFLGEPLIDPRTGRLQDYERFPGDEPPSRFQGNAEADRWGRRILMAINQPDGEKAGPVDKQLLVDLRTIKKTIPIDLQLRFATVAADGTPILPFSPVWPNSVGERLRITVRRSADPLSSPTEDVFQLSGSTGDSPVFQWDIFTSRTFHVEAAFDNFVNAFTPGRVWVEAIATEVSHVGARNRIEGWGVLNDQHFQPAVASPASVILLGARADRRQFIVTNTSTSDLWISFGAIANAGTNSGTLILPPNTTYESPVGGYTGAITATWNGAAPSGGALVSEGVYGAPNIVTA